MRDHEMHHDTTMHTEDKVWIAAGIILNLALLAIVYFSLVGFPSF